MAAVSEFPPPGSKRKRVSNSTEEGEEEEKEEKEEKKRKKRKKKNEEFLVEEKQAVVKVTEGDNRRRVSNRGATRKFRKKRKHLNGCQTSQVEVIRNISRAQGVKLNNVADKQDLLITQLMQPGLTHANQEQLLSTFRQTVAELRTATLIPEEIDRLFSGLEKLY